MDVHDIVQEPVLKASPMKRNVKGPNGCLPTTSFSSYTHFKTKIMLLIFLILDISFLISFGASEFTFLLVLLFSFSVMSDSW